MPRQLFFDLYESPINIRRFFFCLYEFPINVRRFFFGFYEFQINAKWFFFSLYEFQINAKWFFFVYYESSINIRRLFLLIRDFQSMQGGSFFIFMKFHRRLRLLNIDQFSPSPIFYSPCSLQNVFIIFVAYFEY